MILAETLAHPLLISSSHIVACIIVYMVAYFIAYKNLESI